MSYDEFLRAVTDVIDPYIRDLPGVQYDHAIKELKAVFEGFKLNEKLRKSKLNKELLILDSICINHKWAIHPRIKDWKELEKVREVLGLLGYKLRFPRR